MMTFLTSLRRPHWESLLLQYARTLFSRRFRPVTSRTSYCIFTQTRFYHIRFTAGGPAAVCLYRKYLHRPINAKARTILRQYSLVRRIIRINRCHRSMRPSNYGNPVCPTEYLSFDESQTSTGYAYIIHISIHAEFSPHVFQHAQRNIISYTILSTPMRDKNHYQLTRK